MDSGRQRGSILLLAFVLGCACLLQAAGLAAADVPVVINELMASNLSSVADPQNQFDDWIELHNPGDVARGRGRVCT